MTDPMTVNSTSAAPPTASKTTTRKALWIWCMILLIATGVAGSTSWWVFQNVHGTVATLRNTTAPAILDVLAARDALVKADSAAVHSFGSGEVKLSGPGLQHRNQLTFASQRLVQLAEHLVAEQNDAGEAGSQTIQLLEVLLESYSGLIGQAHAHFGTTAGITDLWSASHLVHAGDSPILPELNNLLNILQAGVMNAQISASSMTILNLFEWIVPLIALFVLLVSAQVFLRRRFRRAFNRSLLCATVVLLGLSTVTSLAVVSQLRLEKSRDTLSEAVNLWREHTDAVDAQGQQALSELVKKECEGANGGCGPTVEQFKFSVSTTEEVSFERVKKQVQRFKEDIERAGQYADLWFLIPLAVVFIAVLIPLGIWPRIEEYRYRPR